MQLTKLNKSWRQHPTKQQLYGHLPPITKNIKIRRTRHAGHCWRSRDELISDVLQWTPSHGRAKAGRPARTHIHQLCIDTGCNPEYLPKTMNERERWRGGQWYPYWWHDKMIYIYIYIYIYCFSLFYFLFFNFSSTIIIWKLQVFFLLLHSAFFLFYNFSFFSNNRKLWRISQ